MATLLGLAAMSYAQFPLPEEQTMAPSKSAPVENPPLFIVMGSDDNTHAEAFRWMQSIMDTAGTGRNADGSRRYMSFYVNTEQTGAVWARNNALVNAAYEAYKAGHEIGNHTATHQYHVRPNLDRIGQDVIENEIKRVQDAMVAAGIPKQHHFGFRTPYLAYSDSTFAAIKSVMLGEWSQLLYDCSINAMDLKGGNNWPYTIGHQPSAQNFDGTPNEKGNVPPDNDPSVNNWGQTNPVRTHAGIWELPAMAVNIDPQDREFVANVLAGKRENFDKEAWMAHGRITGLDYNLWNEAELNAGQTISAMLYTVRQSLEGNRAPVAIGIHSQYYFQTREATYPNIADPLEKQRSFRDFVVEASKIPGVFFVSGDMVIRWMMNPVSADEFRPEDYMRAPFTEITPPTNIMLSANSVSEADLQAGNLGVGALRAVNLNAGLAHTFEFLEGGDIFEVDGDTLRFKAAQEPGAYDIKLKATADAEDGESIEREFTILVDKFYDSDFCVIKSSGNWGPSRDNIGSAVTINSQRPLDAAINLTVNQNIDGVTRWPYAGVTKSFRNPLTGLRQIVITYSSDNPISIGIGFWSPQFGFGYAAPLPATGGQNSTVTLTLNDFDVTYADAAAPGSLSDALRLSNLFAQISAVEEGRTANVVVSSFRFIGIQICDAHNFGTLAEVAPTCAVGGHSTRVCSVCGFGEGDIFAALGHDYVWTAVSAESGFSCTEQIEEGNCRRCERRVLKKKELAAHAQARCRDKQKEASDRYGIFLHDGENSLKSGIVTRPVSISIKTPEETVRQKITVFDNSGNAVFNAEIGSSTASTGSPTATVAWDLQNFAGRFVANGTYLIVAEAQGRSGKTHKFQTKIGVKR